MKIGIGSRTFTLSIATALIVLIGVGVVVAGGIAGWEYSNSDAFCANMCHSVHPEETRSHKTSAHARVQCVECHMGRVSTLKLMALKPTHAKELWGMIAGYERPTFGSTLAKEPDRLDAVGAHLDEAIQKGWFPSLTRFFTWLLTATHELVRNYGIAIILITIVVRVLLAPLMARQMRSMKRLSALQPRMKEIQERYPDDRQKQSEAMMALYKEAGVNPLSMMTGCLPMFLQLPVFIGFYYALQGGAIQLRQQPFVVWIDDLSQPEAALACLQVFALGTGKEDRLALESSYFSVRGILAKSVSEGARFAVNRGLAEEGAPVIVRLISQIATRFGMVVSQKLAAQAVPIVGAAVQLNSIWWC